MGTKTSHRFLRTEELRVPLSRISLRCFQSPPQKFFDVIGCNTVCQIQKTIFRAVKFRPAEVCIPPHVYASESDLTVPAYNAPVA